MNFNRYRVAWRDGAVQVWILLSFLPIEATSLVEEAPGRPTWLPVRRPGFLRRMLYVI